MAMHDGEAESSTVRICVFGPENSGKSCLVETLFEEEFHHNESTKGVDIQICTIYANNWKRCTLQEMTDELQRRFLHTLNTAAEMKSSSLKATLATNTTQATSTLQERLVAATKPQKAPEVKPEVIKQAKAIKIINKDGFTAVVWDYAGQIQYLSTHSVFVRKNNVVFIVMKATSKLSGLIDPRPADKESATSSKATHFDVIHYWFQSVTSVCQDKGGASHKSTFLPTIILVVTHMDEIPADIILHFPSITNLKDLVFLSPQWLEKLIAFLVLAHHYRSTGDKDDFSYDRLKGEGVLVGSFLKSMLQMFNTQHRDEGCEFSFDKAVTFLKKFGFIAEISIATEFLEEQHPWSKEEEENIFIVPSQLPEDKGKKKLSFVSKKHVWCIHFVFPDGFIPLTLFHQMVAACINWNGQREQNIAW